MNALKIYLFMYFFWITQSFVGRFEMTGPDAATCTWEEKVLEISFKFFPHYSGCLLSDSIE